MEALVVFGIVFAALGYVVYYVFSGRGHAHHGGAADCDNCNPVVSKGNKNKLTSKLPSPVLPKPNAKS